MYTKYITTKKNVTHKSKLTFIQAFLFLYIKKSKRTQEDGLNQLLKSFSFDRYEKKTKQENKYILKIISRIMKKLQFLFHQSFFSLRLCIKSLKHSENNIIKKSYFTYSLLIFSVSSLTEKHLHNHKTIPRRLGCSHFQPTIFDRFLT